ncbi:hypothetical protein EGI26_20795 [Lacihabitans sp. CCS-44]|uniref:hypothetical protein n=1 Tax=Lacihabitans sp. CCS-44 TaxID=2487331 RepID=UPI0020CE9668|nr:hypothetical protein [Lacihabitans sp. CCS-44]MCP9757608.1 hypothetical protein [Lacihabitans sp. CCS-44]
MKNIVTLFLIFGLFSCGQVKRVDTAEVKQLMADYKIKKVNQEEIIDMANTLGKSISEKFNGNLNIECGDKISVDGTEVELIDLSLVTAETLKNGKIGEILEAYKYSKEQKQTIGDNIQKVNDTLYLYSFPIQVSSLVYKNCRKDLGLIMMPKKALVKSIKK